jgi:predicted O-methyltransferase YrrM
MNSLPTLAIKYFKFCIKSLFNKVDDEHKLFIQNFKQEILFSSLKNKKNDEIELIRKQLLQDNTTIIVEDFGAGSKTNKTKERQICAIAKSALKPKKFGELMQKIVVNNNYKNCLELGTCLGITSSYIATAHNNVNLVTGEGATAIEAKAESVFQQLSLSNIEVVIGNFDNNLQNILSKLSSIDFAFLDGNHQYQPTINYTLEILKKIDENGMIILDDIYWSKEMEEAWNKLKNHPQVTCSIDLFFVGILLFKKDFEAKKHFCFRY